MEGRVRKDTKDEIVLSELRKWEDLNNDCLAKIFEISGMETLIFSAPLVCKNWYTATLNPQCWKVLDFKSVIDSKAKDLHQSEGLDDFMNDDPPVIYDLVKFAVDRSQCSVTKVLLPEVGVDFEDVMSYIANGCPRLMALVLPLERRLMEHGPCMSKLIKKLKHLECLTISCQIDFHDILTEVSTHCKNFVSLTTGPFVSQFAAKSIVTFLPKIKYLTLNNCDLSRWSLNLILVECKYLEFLDVRDCDGFNCYDEEILERSSHIETFLCEGSYKNRLLLPPIPNIGRFSLFFSCS